MAAGSVTLYIATSVDGYIADPEGNVDWLEAVGTDADAGAFREFFETVDCLVMGATTYEQVRGFGEWPYGERPTYVFTHRPLEPATDTVRFVDRAVASVASELRQEYAHVWVVGGAALARSFLRAREVDTVRLSLVPLLLGEGIPLFSGGYDRQPLQLIGTTARESGIVEHHYEVCN